MRKCFVFLIAILSICSCQDLVEERNVERVQKEMEEGIQLFAQKTVTPETRGIALTDRLWETGQTIRIKFLNGSDDQIEKVKLYAAEWLDYANLHFEYVDPLDQAEIKIGFQWNGDPVTWSLVGTEAKLVNQNLPSLNFGTVSQIERFFKRDILMQFGHVLGMVNEHKNSNNPIELDEEVVYAYYVEQGWSIRDINDFFFSPYSSTITNHTEYDSESIMVWPIPEDLTLNGIGQSRNNELSQTDKDFIGTLYPFVPPTDYVTVFGVHITSATTTINMGYVLNTTGHVRIDYGDGEVYEGPGDLIPYHYYYAYDGYDATITVEAEYLSLNLNNFYDHGTRLYRLKLNGFTKYEIMENYSQNFVTIETDPLRPPVFLQEEFPRFLGSAVLKYIPENIFYGAVNAKSFSRTFNVYRNLIVIPENLFANNPNVTDFSYTFYFCQSLTSIPENLFACNPNVITFNGTFSSCHALTSIPENLFANNSNVTDFSYTFAGCTNLTGYAPRLWERENVVGTGCFSGCTGLANYDEIPDDWK